MRKKWTPEPKTVIGVRPPLPVGAIKSAGRVLLIFEYFDEIQRPATVVEISEMLTLPQSSTSALLRSLVAMGYLYFDRMQRVYTPGFRIALLGNWAGTPLFAGGVVLDFMEELRKETGDAVVLAMRQGAHAKYIHVLQATRMARLLLTRGALRPIAGSGTGYALLSTMTDADIRKLVHRVNAESRGGGAEPIELDALLAHISSVRRAGYAFTTDLVTPGGAILAMPLPFRDGNEPLVIGVAGISEVQKKRKAELIKIMHSALERHFS